MSRDESCRVHYRAEDVLMSRQDIKLLMDEVSSLKSQVSSLTCQNSGRFLRFRLEPCYLRLQVAGFFSNLLGQSEASSECHEIALHRAENLRAWQREVVLRVVG